MITVEHQQLVMIIAFVLDGRRIETVFNTRTSVRPSKCPPDQETILLEQKDIESKEDLFIDTHSPCIRKQDVRYSVQVRDMSLGFV